MSGLIALDVRKAAFVGTLCIQLAAALRTMSCACHSISPISPPCDQTLRRPAVVPEIDGSPYRSIGVALKSASERAHIEHRLWLTGRCSAELRCNALSSQGFTRAKPYPSTLLRARPPSTILPSPWMATFSATSVKPKKSTVSMLAVAKLASSVPFEL
jgi:hypothetical protein